MSTITVRSDRIHQRLPLHGLAAILLAAGMLASAGCGAPAPVDPTAQPGPPTAPAAASSSAFSWFKAGPAPAGWHSVELPDRTAVLSYPSDAAPVQSDQGAAAAGITGSDGQLLIFLNATPQQGTESLANWHSFRIDHLTGEHAMSATLGAARTNLEFRGGIGSCVIDDYVTRIGVHHYREIACLVAGARGSNVIVAAAPASAWNRYRNMLEQAVDSYEVR